MRYHDHMIIYSTLFEDKFKMIHNTHDAWVILGWSPLEEYEITQMKEI